MILKLGLHQHCVSCLFNLLGTRICWYLIGILRALYNDPYDEISLRYNVTVLDDQTPVFSKRETSGNMSVTWLSVDRSGPESNHCFFGPLSELSIRTSHIHRVHKIGLYWITYFLPGTAPHGAHKQHLNTVEQLPTGNTEWTPFWFYDNESMFTTMTNQSELRKTWPDMTSGLSTRAFIYKHWDTSELPGKWWKIHSCSNEIGLRVLSFSVIKLTCT